MNYEVNDFKVRLWSVDHFDEIQAFCDANGIYWRFPSDMEDNGYYLFFPNQETLLLFKMVFL